MKLSLRQYMCGESGSELQSPAMAFRGEYRTSGHIMALSSHSGSTHAVSLGQSSSHQLWPGEVNTGHQVTHYGMKLSLRQYTCCESGSELQSPAMAWRGEYRTSGHIMAWSSHSGSTHAESLSQSCSLERWIQDIQSHYGMKLSLRQYTCWVQVRQSCFTSNGLERWIRNVRSHSFPPSSFRIWTAYFAQLLTQGTLTNSRSFIFGDSNWKFC